MLDEQIELLVDTVGWEVVSIADQLFEYSVRFEIVGLPELPKFNPRIVIEDLFN